MFQDSDLALPSSLLGTDFPLLAMFAIHIYYNNYIRIISFAKIHCISSTDTYFLFYSAINVSDQLLEKLHLIK